MTGYQPLTDNRNIALAFAHDTWHVPSTFGLMHPTPQLILKVPLRFIFGTFTCLILGCGAAAPMASQRETSALTSHQRMLAELEKIKERTDWENEFLGEWQLPEAEARLEAWTEGDPLVIKIELLRVMGVNQLRLGRLDEAVKQLTIARDLSLEHHAAPEGFDETLMLLAIAHLRRGEADNCIACQTGESCVFPIRKGGRHKRPTGSSDAIRTFEALLARNPNDLMSRWLLNIAHMTLGTYPEQVPATYLIPPEAFVSDEEFPQFENIALQIGFDRRHLAGGAITEDFDGDGLLDVVTSTMDTSDTLRYYRNQGDGSFRERTEEAGFTGIYGGLNVIQGDYDNDGAVDLLVLRGGWLGEAGKHPKSLLRNNGRGEFTDVTFDVGLEHAMFPSQTASWGDYDLDGDLDLYIGNEKYPCQLFQNQGDGRFHDVTRTAGVENLRHTKGVVWGDYDGDRWPDLYVSNYQGENRLYRNLGNGAFSDVAPDLDVTAPHKSFPVWFWDFNNDGVLDLFVGAYTMGVEHVAASYLGLPHSAELCCLYRGNGSGGFDHVTAEMNLTRVTQPMGVNFGDLDNDGFLDFYLGTGYPGFEALMPNIMYHNQGGRRFADVTTAGGFGHLQKGHGVAFADLDQDGDQDVFAQLGGALKSDVFTDALFENPGFGNNWLIVKLVGKESNSFGVGSRIRANFREKEASRDVFRWVNSGGSFGCNPLRQMIGLGQAATVDTLEVFWPKTGRTQTFSDISAGQMIEITEDQDEYRVLPYPSTPFHKKQPPRLNLVTAPE